MSQIRCIYHASAPSFPATDQHPQAQRYSVRSEHLGRDVLVDAVGGEPTTQEVDAVLNPPLLSAAAKFAAMGITPEDVKAYLATAK